MNQISRFAGGGFGATLVAFVFPVGMLTGGCARSVETSTSAPQPVISGTLDGNTAVANGVVQIRTNTSTICSGTLITSTYVLTAAHCVVGVPDANRVITIGADAIDPYLLRLSTGCWMHPLAYNTGSSNCLPAGSIPATPAYGYDVAILRLGQPLDRVVARPTGVSLQMPTGLGSFAGQVVKMVGFGLPNSPAWRRWGLTRVDYHEASLQTYTPGYWADGGVIAQSGDGDSGGPLLFPGDAPRPSVIGVDSAYEAGILLHWAPTTAPNVARWINNVMTNGTTSYTTGTTTGPSGGWIGEGADRADNCPGTFNPTQDDSDGDGRGNECDVCPGGASHVDVFDHDEDGDGVSTECGDTCPGVANASQTDTDGDGWGDVCDLCVAIADPPRRGATDLQPNCNEATEAEQSRPALGDRCDPYPCNPLDNVNSSFDWVRSCEETADPAEDHCLRGSDHVQVGYAPRVGAGASVPWTPTSTAQPLTSPLWRCPCIRASDDMQINDAADCMHPVTGACPRDGAYRNVVGGYGWRHAAVDAPGWATAGSGLAPVWGAPIGTLAPRLEYLTAWTRSEAAARWRLLASGAASGQISFWNWNWSAPGELYPAAMPRAQAFIPFTNPPRVAFWTRAQPLDDPGDNPATEAYRVARMQDAYAPDVAILEETHVLAVPRPSARIFVNVDVRSPPLPIGPFPCPTPLAELVSRFRPRVLPLTAQSPGGASAMFFPNGSINDPTRGVVVALFDVRHDAIAYTAATGAVSAADLPVQSDLSFALGKMDARGFPEVYAFGGRNADASLSRALYHTSHTYDANGRVVYKWHRVDGPADLAPREDSALVAGADGQNVYVIGGRSGVSVYADVWRYQLATGVWRQVELTASFPARYDATAVAMNDRLFVGGGITAGGGYLGDLLEIDGLTGGVMSYGSVLPVGALPDLTFDAHYEGLIYAGGYVGATWYRDLWTVRLLGSSATTTFIHDFGGDGLAATQRYAVVGDLAHDAFWAVPGLQVGGSGQKVWFLQDGVASTGGGGALRVATGGSVGPDGPTTSSPARRTNPRGAPQAVQVRPRRLAGGVR